MYGCADAAFGKCAVRLHLRESAELIDQSRVQSQNLHAGNGGLFSFMHLHCEEQRAGRPMLAFQKLRIGVEIARAGVETTDIMVRPVKFVPVHRVARVKRDEVPNLLGRELLRTPHGETADVVSRPARRRRMPATRQCR